MALFTARVEAGISELGRCCFITVTYRVDGKRREDAASVRRDWKELWRRWKKGGEPKFHWLRVIELTEKKQPHVHLVVGPVEGKMRCYGSEGPNWKAFKKDQECRCLSHRMSRVWYGITGAWIVHAVPVTGAPGAGAYLGKYMRKQLYTSELRAAGFKRSWSTSRGWPGNGRMRLRLTVCDGWVNPFYSDTAPPDGHENYASLVERVGPAPVAKVFIDRKKRIARKKLERVR